MSESIEAINRDIVGCRLCPRLVAWRESVAADPPKRYAGETYWAKGVPAFGDPDAELLILGLAPAAHGANRTGRMFTGDRSGDWLFRALYRAGLASQPESISVDDGLRLHHTIVFATAHCAPPANKPTPNEIGNCSGYLRRAIGSRRWNAILCLGSIAWNHVHRVLGLKAPPFAHGAEHQLTDGTVILASYHPSQQNTFTGKLTEQMLDDVVGRFASLR